MALARKKEALFKKQDVTKWGGFKDNLEAQVLKDELVQNKEKAFTYMLPKESKELE